MKKERHIVVAPFSCFPATAYKKAKTSYGMTIRITTLCVTLLLLAVVGFSQAQQYTLSGKVFGKTNNEPLQGVNVSVKGSSVSVMSDAAGTYSISAPKGSMVLFSYAGMTTLAHKLNRTAQLDIFMEASQKNLDEVVVIGYGSRKRRDLTTAVSSVSSKVINSTPVADAAQSLQGRVSGVTIVQNSGAPGGTGGTGIRIRGISSLTGTNNPLIVVDGYPLPDQQADNVLNSFGVNDIENIDVLKDAAAAAIYGVRASNGVIIITTKRGRPGKSGLTVDYYRGLQKAWNLPTMLDAREYAIMNTEAQIASGLPPIPKLVDFNAIATQYGKGTDWLNEVFRQAAIQSINLTASGGSDKSQFLLSAGYFRQDGIIYKTDFERFTLRFNGDVKVNNNIRIGNTLSINKIIEHGADTYSPFNSIVLLALTAPPTVSPRNPDGSYAGGNGNVDGFSEPNPIYVLEVPKNVNTKYRITGNIFAEIGFARNFRFKTLVGGDFNYQEINNFRPATPSSGGQRYDRTDYSVQRGFYPDYLFENTLTFEKRFGLHQVNAVAGTTFQENRYSYVVAGRGGNFTQNIPVLNNQVFQPTDISQTYNASEDGINQRLISYFTRINYDYDSRYYFGFSLRRDGSSNFAPKNRFAIFPAVSGAWRISREAFFGKSKWIDDLKLRASFGYTGNPNVQANSYLQRINQSFQYTLGNSSGSGGIVSGAGPSASYNPDIKWEKNEQLNFGADLSAFGNRFTLSFDVYQRRSKDLILYVAPPFVSGTYESVPYNTGTLQNRGFDFTFNGRLIDRGAFSWSLNAVASAYRNEVISLGLSAPLDKGFSRITGGSLRTIQGAPADFFYGFVTEGIFQNYAEIAAHAKQAEGTDPTTSTAPGDIRFKDLNRDGIINDKDRTNIGNANPNFTFGLTNTFQYRNFELTLFIQGSQGNKVLNFTRWYTEGGVSNGNYSNAVIGRWTGQGSSNDMPRVTLNDPNGNNRVSDRFVEDASYVRIKNLRLAYNLSSRTAERMKIKRTQFYVSAQNLLTLTNYSGMDPEVGGGVDIGFYPQARTFLAGITIEL